MKVTMPRYELQPVTMARMENSNTCGSLYFCPCPRRGSGTSASRSSNGANVVTATSDSVAAPGVRHPPIRESLFSSAASLRTACVAARTHFSLPNSIEQPWPEHGRVVTWEADHECSRNRRQQPCFREGYRDGERGRY